ncbi:MAG: hypothetical protein AAGD10_21250 [Myxococcota bacterium]
MTVRLAPIAPTWVAENDDGTDLCAHGGVQVWRDDELLLDSSDEEWSIGAGALFLLRSLDPDYDLVNAVGKQLIPHCANAFFINDVGEFVTIGCPHALESSVVHAPDGVEVRLGGVELRMDGGRVNAGDPRLLQGRSSVLRCISPKTAVAGGRGGVAGFRPGMGPPRGGGGSFSRCRRPRVTEPMSQDRRA